jgi:SAM-dependent methyltransferase
MNLEQFLETARAFQESRAILTGVELNVFTTVGAGGAAADVANRIKAQLRSTEMLLNALTAVGLLEKRNGVFHNTPFAARYLDDASPDSIRLATMHSVGLWARWSTLTECVRLGTSVARDDIKDRGEDWTEAFIAAMHRNAFDRAPQVVHTVGAESVHRMLDVGGGSGAYSVAFAQAAPDLCAVVFDLLRVTAIAQRHIDAAGLRDRVMTRAGDFRTDDLGAGFDLVFVSAICHMLDENENRTLLRKCYEALVPAGRLVIQDFILEPDKTAPKTAALFSLNMLVGTRAGASYSVDEYTAWMRESGFEDVKRSRLAGPAGLITGRKTPAG